MENIHLIPTNKYSKLVHSTSKYGGLFLSKYYSPMKDMGDSYQHIYITNDEEIEEGDLKIVKYYGQNPQVVISTYSNSVNNLYTLEYHKKIILTTDQDLIKDGVQKIDDEFLHWFVKNPSCEKVEVIQKQHFEADKSKRINPLNGVYYSWKIIIPKEEPKDFLGRTTFDLLKQEVMREFDNQETLEKAAERMYNIKEIKEIHVSIVKQGCLYEGGSWSDEHERLVRLEFDKWFNQNKNETKL
jgi:hypothetical protein